MNNKPIKHDRSPIYLYSECRDYLQEKYGYDESDYLGKFKGGQSNEGVEYLNFWHWVCDNFEVSNGGEITFNKETLQRAKGPLIRTANRTWVREILEHYLSEFGEGPHRELTMLTEW